MTLEEFGTNSGLVFAIETGQSFIGIYSIKNFSVTATEFHLCSVDAL